jgi:hypothetical protein
MERHFRKHTGLKQAHCQTCNKGFDRKDSLLEHEASVACRSRREEIQCKATATISLSPQNAGISDSSTTSASGGALDWHAGIDNGAGKRFCKSCNTWFLRFDLFLKHVMDVCPIKPEGDKSQVLNPYGEPVQHVPKPVAMSGDLYGYDPAHSTEPVYDPLHSGSLSQTVAPNLIMSESASNNSTSESKNMSLQVFNTVYDPGFQCFICRRKHCNLEEYIEHLNQHMNDAVSPCRYACTGCDTSFHHLFELDAHQKAVKHLKKGEGRCHSCGHTFGYLSVRLHEHLGVHLKGGISPAGLHGACYQIRLDKNTALSQRIQDQISSLYLVCGRGT